VTDDRKPIDRIIAVYSGRTDDLPGEAQIGMVWHADYIDEIIDHGKSTCDAVLGRHCNVRGIRGYLPAARVSSKAADGRSSKVPCLRLDAVDVEIGNVDVAGLERSSAAPILCYADLERNTRGSASKGLLRNNLVTFLNASCSELWAG
jgi:hypothetical protein